VQQRSQRLDELLERMRLALERLTGAMKERLQLAAVSLEALSPLRVLERGYSVTFGPAGRVLRSAAGLSEGDVILTRLLEGQVRSRVLDVAPEGSRGGLAEGGDDG